MVFKKLAVDEKYFWPLVRDDSARIIVTPFIQVFSVSLHSYAAYDDKPSEIYGSIYSTNSRGVISNLYTRYFTNPETVPNRAVLSLNEGFDILLSYGPSTNTSIDLDLRDKSRNTVVIKQKHNLHSVNEEDFEDTSNKLIKGIVSGERGYALVYYAKFLYAYRAFVYVAIFTKRDTTSSFVDVYGSIAVGYDNARQFCNNDDEMRHMKCLLFNKPFDKPQRVVVGRGMELSRYLVVLPAGSSLVVDADVSDSIGRLVGGSVEFHFGGQSKKSIDDKFGTVKVIVAFDSTCAEFIPDIDSVEDVREAEVDALTEDSLVGVSNLIDDQKNSILVPSHQQQNLTSTPSGGGTSSSSSESSERFHGSVLAEFFSVQLCGTNHEVSAVCGKISVEETFMFPGWNIFERDLDNPDIFSEWKDRSLLLENHRQNDCHDYKFHMYINLIDPTNNTELCRGRIDYNHILHERYVPLNKRVCSYIKGAHGYALLHYIIFESACQATVEIRFLPDDHPSASHPIFICGSIFATYSNQSYCTGYTKKYYRSRLFSKPQADCVQLVGDLRIPLSKSVVVVPKGVNLVVEVDLDTVSSSNGKDVVFGKKEMKISSSKTIHAEILGKYSGVQISAKFKKC